MRKYFLLLIITAFFVSGCSKDEPLELNGINPEAFAFNLGDMWEVNASVIVKGFKLEEENKTYSPSIEFSVDLVKPNGEKVENLFNDKMEKSFEEKIKDVKLEAQFELDETFEEGNYKVVFRIKDLLNNSSTTVEKEFVLD